MRLRLVQVFVTLSLPLVLSAIGTSQTLKTPEEVLALLRQPMDFEFENKPLSEIADSLSKQVGVDFIIDQSELSDWGSLPEHTMTVRSRGGSLHTGLMLLLEPYDLSYSIGEGFVRITSAEAAEDELATVVYDVTRLVKGEPEYQSPSLAVVQHDYPLPTLPAEYLINLIQNTIAVDMWGDVGGTGLIEAYSTNGRHSLVISQTPDVHFRIYSLLDRLRKLASGGVEPEHGDWFATIQSRPCVRLYRIKEDSNLNPTELAKLIETGFELSDSMEEDHWSVPVGSWVIVRAPTNVQDEVHNILKLLRALNPKPIGGAFGPGIAF